MPIEARPASTKKGPCFAGRDGRGSSVQGMGMVPVARDEAAALQALGRSERSFEGRVFPGPCPFQRLCRTP